LFHLVPIENKPLSYTTPFAHMPSQLLNSSFPSSSRLIEKEISCFDPDLLPRHVAIIMDGNRRWAKHRGLPPTAGHWRGAATLTRIVRASSDLGIKTLTVFVFSTENWKRPPEEIDALMNLIKIYLIKQRESMLKEGVRLDSIGDLSPFPKEVQEELEKTKKVTANGSKIDLVLALNYGGRDEIKRTIQAVVKDCLEGKLSSETLTEETITSYLDTAKWEDPQLIIRTSGEKRLSNFLLWQASYAEVYISEVLWPDFQEKDLFQALKEHQRRVRRIGC